MAQVELSRNALADLESIYSYVCEDSELHAQNLISKFYERFEVLKTHAKIGKVVPEFKDNSIRELIQGQYRIIYKINREEIIVIARIYHSARLLKRL